MTVAIGRATGWGHEWLYIVDDPSGTPTDKKVASSNVGASSSAAYVWDGDSYEQAGRGFYGLEDPPTMGSRWQRTICGTTPLRGDRDAPRVATYKPSTELAPATTSTTYADVDAMNPAITFTAPGSGAVIVTLSGYAEFGANTVLS